MSKYLLREYYELCHDGVCQDLLSEQEKREVRGGAVFLSGVMQRCDQKNGNGRIYPKTILEREAKNYMKAVKENRACGELDHPEDSVVNLKNASHRVTDLWWQGNDLMGKIKVLSTPSGQILRSLIDDGVTLGISSRALGSVHESNGAVIVEDDLQLICFDIVSEPSTKGAFMHLNESKNTQPYSRADKINRLLNDITKI